MEGRQQGGATDRSPDNSAAPLRVGVIGTVSSYSLLVPEALTELPGITLAGAAHLGRHDHYMTDSLELPWLKRFPKNLADYAARFKMSLFGSADELFDAGVDAVVLGTEEYLRTRYAIAALERGVHVYLPKPFAYTAEDAARLREAAGRSQGILFPGLPHRWNAHYRRAVELLQPDGLGRPLLVRTSITHHLSTGPWKSDPTLAAGPEYEMGFYAVDALLMAAGAKALAVTAQGRNFIHTGMDTFDFATMQVTFENGTVGTSDLYCGMHYPYTGHELSAIARDGAVRVGRDHAGKTEMRVYGAQGDRVEDVPALGRGAELAHWVDLCRRADRAGAAEWFETGCRTLEVLLAFEKSWRSGATVEVTPV